MTRRKLSDADLARIRKQLSEFQRGRRSHASIRRLDLDPFVDGLPALLARAQNMVTWTRDEEQTAEAWWKASGLQPRRAAQQKHALALVDGLPDVVLALAGGGEDHRVTAAEVEAIRRHIERLADILATPASGDIAAQRRGRGRPVNIVARAVVAVLAEDIRARLEEKEGKKPAGNGVAGEALQPVDPIPRNWPPLDPEGWFVWLATVLTRAVERPNATVDWNPDPLSRDITRPVIVELKARARRRRARDSKPNRGAWLASLDKPTPGV